jgi:sialate O-acetylesterase
LVALLAAAAPAAVRLPAIFGDNMVLQRGQPLPVWGWAEKGEEITVAMAGQSLAAKAGDDGRWKVTLAKLHGQLTEVAVRNPSGDTRFVWIPTPLTMTVKGSSGNTLTFKNVWVGEVWVCSGQSNMHWTFDPGHGVMNNDAEVAAAKYPDVRMFTAAKRGAPQPAADVPGTWLPITPENLKVGGPNGASALAYFFGRELHQALHVPIGLINTSVGGTPAEFWTSRKALEAIPALKPLAGHGESSVLYNAMIAPLIPYAIRGAIWYQGESNAGRAYQYRTLLPAMIANWRADWRQGDFPFGIVQLAPFRYGGQNPANCAELWEAQLIAANSVPNAGLAVTMDIGDPKDIHPKNKQEVGRRLALWALAKVYGRSLVYSGPIYKSMAIEDGKIRLRFDHPGGGLIAADGKPLSDFTIAGADQKFVPAVATIDGRTIVVHADQIAQPVAVRYAWRDDATPNLANKDGLPASPFRTDQWKGLTEGK